MMRNEPCTSVILNWASRLCIDSPTPSSKDTYSTLPIPQSIFANCITNELLPLALGPLINHVSPSSG